MGVGLNDAGRQWSGASDLVPFEGDLINTQNCLANRACTWQTEKQNIFKSNG